MRASRPKGFGDPTKGAKAAVELGDFGCRLEGVLGQSHSHLTAETRNMKPEISAKALAELRLGRGQGLQGYLAQKKQRRPRTLLQGYA